MSALVISLTFVLKSGHILSHCHALLLSFLVKLLFNEIKVSLCCVALFSENLDLLFAVLKVSTVRKDLILYFLALWKGFKFNKSSLTIDGFTFLLSLLLKTKLFKLLFRIIFLILTLRTRFIVVSLHAKDLFLSLFADLNFVNGTR
jgi:hypothetical protein